MSACVYFELMMSLVMSLVLSACVDQPDNMAYDTYTVYTVQYSTYYNSILQNDTYIRKTDVMQSSFFLLALFTFHFSPAKAIPPIKLNHKKDNERTKTKQKF